MVVRTMATLILVEGQSVSRSKDRSAHRLRNAAVPEFVVLERLCTTLDQMQEANTHPSLASALAVAASC